MPPGTLTSNHTVLHRIIKLTTDKPSPRLLIYNIINPRLSISRIHLVTYLKKLMCLCAEVVTLIRIGSTIKAVRRLRTMAMNQIFHKATIA